MKIDKELDIEKPKYVDVPEVPRRSGQRKNTKRWCKGKVGREHTPETKKMNRAWRQCGPCSWAPDRWWCNHEIVCTTCGKVMKAFLGDGCPDKPDA